jgi:hypothetical protein
MAQFTPQASLDAIFKADTSKNSIFVQALRTLGLYSSVTGTSFRGTLFPPTNAVSVADSD